MALNSEILQQYLSNNAFCSICLKTNSDEHLVNILDVDLFTEIQVAQLTPYLCLWCHAKLKVFQRFKGNALKARTWLSNLYQSPGFLHDNILLELAEIKKSAHGLKSCSVHLFSCNSSHQQDEDQMSVKQEFGNVESGFCEEEVKLEPEYTKSDFDYDSYTVEKILFVSMPLEESKSVNMGTCIDQQCHSLHQNDDISSQIQGLEKRSHIDDKSGDVTLDELDDINSMITNLLNERTSSIMISEDEYREEHQSRLLMMAQTSPPYKCEYCALCCSEKDQYDKHMTKHSKDRGSFRCHLCSTYYRTRCEQSTHTSGHLRRYVCNECGRRAARRVRLATHIFSEHTSTLFNCKYCGLESRSPFIVREHIRSAHKKSVANKKECEICKKMISESSFTRHTRTHYDASVKCKHCDKTFKSALILTQHISAQHPQEVKHNTFTECKICNETLPTSDIKKHSKKHLEQAHCAICNKILVNKYALQEHNKNFHNPKRVKFQCNDCGIEYATKASLRRHIMFVHLKTAGVACSECGKVWSHIGELNSHVKNVHKKHLAKRDKICDFCGRGFTTTVILENHRMIHTGEKPYACRECGQMFRQTAALRTHTKLKHGKKLSLVTVAKKSRFRPMPDVQDK